MGTEAEAGDRSSRGGARRSGTGVADGLGGTGGASPSESEAGWAVGHALGDGNGTAAAAGAGAGAGAQIALAAQLQRAEAERRRLEEEVSELAAALQEARAAADEGAQAALQAREADERCQTLTASIEKLLVGWGGWERKGVPLQQARQWGKVMRWLPRLRGCR